MVCFISSLGSLEMDIPPHHVNNHRAESKQIPDHIQGLVGRGLGYSVRKNAILEIDNAI